jgi:hypothetical protein
MATAKKTANKATQPNANDKLSIHNEMACFDLKDRGLYDSLTDEERKKFSSYLMIRWGSAVEGSADLQKFYVIATNERLNKHFFSINRHPKLQWLSATTVSPGMGRHRHTWIAGPKKNKSSGARHKFLMTLYPAMKASDIETLASVMSESEYQQLQQDHGLDK